VRLIYIDESYNEDFYWFGALSIAEEEDAGLQRAVLAVPGRFRAHGVQPNIELHGYDIWNGRNEWSPIHLNYPLREHVFRVTLRAAAEAQASIAFVGLDRRANNLQELPKARCVAIEKLLECLESENEKTGERCLLIFDEETSTTKELISAVHNHHRAILLNNKAPRIVERPLITPSHVSPGIQVADLAAYVFRRSHSHLETDERAQGTINRLLKLMQPMIICVFEH
jgi:hypothetical protein